MVESELAANTYLCKIDPQLLLSSLPPVICTQKSVNSTHRRKTWNQPAPKNVQDVQVWIESCRWQCRIDPKFDQFTSHSATDCQSSGQTCIKKRLSKESFSGCEIYKHRKKLRNCPLFGQEFHVFNVFQVCPVWCVLVCPDLTWSALV